MPTTPDIKDFRLACLFRDLDRALLAQIVERACWRELDAGELLFAKNDPGNRFFLVKTGTMQLFLLAEDGQEHVMELIGREHLFAEAVMFIGRALPGLRRRPGADPVDCLRRQFFPGIVAQ